MKDQIEAMQKLLQEQTSQIDLELKAKSFAGYMKRLGLSVWDDGIDDGETANGMVVITVAGEFNKKQLAGIIKYKEFVKMESHETGYRGAVDIYFKV